MTRDEPSKGQGQEKSKDVRRRPSNSDVICTRGTSAAFIPRGEEVVEAARFVDNAGFDGSTASGTLGKRCDRSARRFPGGRVQARIEISGKRGRRKSRARTSAA